MTRGCAACPPPWRDLIAQGVDACAGDGDAIRQFLRGVRQTLDTIHQGKLPLTDTTEDLTERRKLTLSLMREMTKHQDDLPAIVRA